MARRYRVNRRRDAAHFKSTATKTKAVNRTIGNAQGGIRF